MEKTQWAYSENVKRHFMHPQNTLQVTEEEYGADGIGMIGSPACGDMMQVLIKVTDGRISDFKWKTFGCASAIASTSALSELVLKDGGMSLKEAYAVTPEEIIKNLGGLPSNKIHCSVLGDKALRAAIDDYFERKGEKTPFNMDESPIICECMNLTVEDIRMEVLEGSADFEAVQKATGAATACGKCEGNVREKVDEFVKQYYTDSIYNPEG
ncbi:MAG: iron-sulfur cluster assembly scaffold protein [Spirochaetota bacterium]